MNNTYPMAVVLLACLPGLQGVHKLTAQDSAAFDAFSRDTTSHPRNGLIQVDGAILKTIESTTLASPLSGILVELNAKEGDLVTLGQQLGRIQDDAIRLELERLKTYIQMTRKKQANDINSRLAEKSQQVAETEYQRALKANARVTDTYPINEIDRLRLVADHAALEVERAQYEQEMAEFEVTLAISEYRKSYELFSRHQIKALVNGIVVSVMKRAGEWVEPGMDLLKIVRIDRLRVEGFITARQAMQQIVGNDAWLDVLGDDQADPLPGKVVFVSPDVNPANSQVRVFIEVDNINHRLRPGLPVKAHIVAREPVDLPPADFNASR